MRPTEQIIRIKKFNPNRPLKLKTPKLSPEEIREVETTFIQALENAAMEIRKVVFELPKVTVKQNGGPFFRLKRVDLPLDNSESIFRISSL